MSGKRKLQKEKEKQKDIFKTIILYSCGFQPIFKVITDDVEGL